MNDFEKYIVENKQKLEPDAVDSRVWLEIENEMLRSKNSNYRTYGRILLAIIACLLIAAFSYYFFKPVEINEDTIIAELNLAQYNYPQTVSLKEQKLSEFTLPKDKLDDVQILLRQLEFMDEQYQDYLLFIKENGYHQFIGEQIITFYESKIILLDKIQKEIEKINYYEKKIPSNSERVTFNI